MAFKFDFVFFYAQCQVQISDLNLTGTKIDSFRSAISYPYP